MKPSTTEGLALGTFDSGDDFVEVLDVTYLCLFLICNFMTTFICHGIYRDNCMDGGPWLGDEQSFNKNMSRQTRLTVDGNARIYCLLNISFQLTQISCQRQWHQRHTTATHNGRSEGNECGKRAEIGSRKWIFASFLFYLNCYFWIVNMELAKWNKKWSFCPLSTSPASDEAIRNLLVIDNRICLPQTLLFKCSFIFVSSDR